MASSNKYSTLTQFPCNFSFLPASLAFLCGCQHTHTFLGQRNDYSKANKKKKKKEEGRLGVFDRGNGPTGSCIQRDRVVVCAESWRFLFFCPFFFGWGAMLKWGKVGGGGGGGGGESSVVGVGVIVGDGAEKESVLRPGCWPSGEKLFQRRLKWSGPRSTLRREKCCARVSFIYFFFWSCDKSERWILSRVDENKKWRHRHVWFLSPYLRFTSSTETPEKGRLLFLHFL